MFHCRDGFYILDFANKAYFLFYFLYGEIRLFFFFDST